MKIFWLTFVAVTSLIFAFVLTVQLPQVQTFIASNLLEKVSEKMDGDIFIEKLHIKPFNTLVLKNTVIIDKNPILDPCDSSLAPIDTFFRAEYIIAKFTLRGLLHSESIRIKSAYVGNAQMNLVLEDFLTENDSIIKYNNLSRIFRIKKKDVKIDPSPEEIFRIRNIEISDMGFAMLNRSSDKTPYHGGINWNDLDIKSIELNAKGLRFKDGIMYGKAESLSFTEKSGFRSNLMSGKARVGRGKTIIEDFNLKDEWSDIDIPLFMMSYDNVDDFKDFIHKVCLDAKLDESFVDFRTITHFAPQLKDNKLKAAISGSISGCIDDFAVIDMKLYSLNQNFEGKVNGRIRGIPDVDSMRLKANISDMKMTIDGLGDFVSHWIPDGELDLGGFGDGEFFYGKASAIGPLNHLNVNTTLSSDIGKIRASAQLNDIIEKETHISINGNIKTETLNIGRIINSPLIGSSTFDTALSLCLGKEVLEVDMDVLNIDSLVLNGYKYRDILARGQYDNRSFNGTVISKDPNLNFIFQGGYAKSDKSNNTVYKFDASIGHADLNAINLDKRGKSIVQFRTSANFTKTRYGNLLGRVDMGEIMLENGSGRYDIGDIVIKSHSADHKYHTRLDSKFAQASFTGTSSIFDFFKEFLGITISKELPAIIENQKYKWNGNTYSLDMTCHDVQKVLAFAVPGLYIEDGTTVKAEIDNNGSLNTSLLSGRIAYKRNYLKGINLNLNNSDAALNGNLKCDEIVFSKINTKDNLLEVHINDNRFGAGFSFDNHNETETKGELIVNGIASKEEDETIFDINIKPSSIHYDSKEWSIQPSNIRIEGGDMEIDSFGVVSGEQSVGLFGRTSIERNDVLTLNLERFDLSILNAMMPSDYGLKGAVTGFAQVTSPTDELELTIDLLCDSAYVADIPVGIVRLKTDWDETNNKFKINVSNSLAGKKNFDISGYYKPGNRNLYADAVFEEFNIGYAQPLVSTIFSQMNGNISGLFKIDGPLNKLKLSSKDAFINDADLTIDFTGVPYHVQGPFHIDEKGVHFDKINIKDRYDGTGYVTGSILYDHFKDIFFDTHISVNRIEAINIDENNADTFYGKLFGSGNLSIIGPVHSLVMDIDAVTAKAGELHIPVSSSLTSQKGTNLLRFKELDLRSDIDPYEIFVQKSEKANTTNSNFLVRLKVNALPDVQAFVEIDKASGNVLSGRGNGNISLNVSEDLFNINGDYTLTSGNYKFVAMGLVGRDFTIQDGSSIRFNGDIMESTLDINALYRTKASISTLISDTTSVANRRIVDCGISIKDKLSNPQLDFSIEIPDLDPTIKSRVESALSTEDKVQKQFLSLIISNNFLPDEQSGIVNNSSVLYSNVTELMANQINNILQKLDIPLDLGLNYQPNERGNDIFDVAVSTQLFNNRVIVNGNIGNRQYNTGNSQNDVVGDIDIEIKLDRSGSFRLNLFSHSADQYTNYLDNSQRNGIGVTYQTEFNSIGRFFRNLFSNKNKRLEERRMEEEAAISEERVNIVIDSTEQ